MDQVFPQYQTFIEGRTAVPDVPRNPYIGEVGPQATSPAHLSMCQHLCKVIQELVDTEKSYVKVSTAVLLLEVLQILILLLPQFVVLFFILNLCPKQERVDLLFSLVLQDLVCLLDVYLTPLQKETFLTKDEVKPLKPFGPMRCQNAGGVLTTMSLPQMEVLFGSLPEMLDFHRVFLQTLEDRISSCPNFSSLDTPAQFKVNVSLQNFIFQQQLLFQLSLLWLEDAPLLIGRIFSGLCRSLQALQRLLCKPHQSPESPGAR